MGDLSQHFSKREFTCKCSHGAEHDFKTHKIYVILIFILSIDTGTGEKTFLPVLHLVLSAVNSVL